VLRPEVSWNFGASLTQEFKIGEMQGTFVTDFYRTNFENQLVADFEDPKYIRFYNLKGRAFANSFQAEVNLTPVKRLDFKLAYRLFDVKQTVYGVGNQNVLLPKMLVNRDRVLFNAGYALPYDKWKFDATVQWNGKRRLTSMSPMYGMPGHSGDEAALKPAQAPAFYTVNAQITRTFPKWDVYIGGENLNNFRQKNPIYTAYDPFGTQFDAGMAWGPVVGRMIYAGIRYKIIR
jgi:outer membrane receptor for ferrienterochelin and colicins